MYINMYIYIYLAIVLYFLNLPKKQEKYHAFSLVRALSFLCADQRSLAANETNFLFKMGAFDKNGKSNIMPLETKTSRTIKATLLTLPKVSLNGFWLVHRIDKNACSSHTRNE